MRIDRRLVYLDVVNTGFTVMLFSLSPSGTRELASKYSCCMVNIGYTKSGKPTVLAFDNVLVSGPTVLDKQTLCSTAQYVSTHSLFALFGRGGVGVGVLQLPLL